MVLLGFISVSTYIRAYTCGNNLYSIGQGTFRYHLRLSFAAANVVSCVFTHALVSILKTGWVDKTNPFSDRNNFTGTIDPIFCDPNENYDVIDRTKFPKLLVISSDCAYDGPSEDEDEDEDVEIGNENSVVPATAAEVDVVCGCCNCDDYA